MKTTNQKVSEQTAEQTIEETIAIAKKSNVPGTDLELLNLCLNVEKKWKATPAITIPWTTQNEFSKFILDFEKAYNIRVSAGDQRPIVTQQLKDIDKQIDDSISFVKGYISEKFGKKEEISHYAEFGIVKIADRYAIPTDRDFRNEALKKLLDAIIKNGFGAATYGEKHWKAIRDNYNKLLQSAISTDSTVSKHVSSKNEIKKYMKKALNSLIHIIRGSYPDTYKAELRNWGFQKEKY